MELADTWACGGCSAENTGDVFSAACWKCGSSWARKQLRIETAEELRMCPDCRAMDGFHTINCPTHPLPRTPCGDGNAKP
jgi:hypothetical protein